MKLKITFLQTTLLSHSLPKNTTERNKRSRSNTVKTLEADQKEILMWVFRWMAKVPGHFVTQQAAMLPGLWTRLESFLFVCVCVCVCVCVFFFSSFFLREARKQTGH